jgi:methionyl-tRNA synthetase
MRVLLVVLLALFVSTACSEPPQKELDRAQGAIDAARAAGAEQYAPQSFAAATSALKQAHDAVEQRDYRLALTRALDASDRANDAAKGAADGKARALSDAETAITAVAAALTRLQTRINADRPRVPKRALDAAVRAQKDAEVALQKARAALGSGNYLEAKETLKDVDSEITAQIRALDSDAQSRPAKPPRRRS